MIPSLFIYILGIEFIVGCLAILDSFWGLLLYKLCTKSCGTFYHLAKVNKFHQWIPEKQEAREAAHPIYDPIFTCYKRNFVEEATQTSRKEGGETEIDTDMMGSGVMERGVGHCCVLFIICTFVYECVSLDCRQCCT